MLRRDFLRFLGLTAAGAALPALAESAPKTIEEVVQYANATGKDLWLCFVGQHGEIQVSDGDTKWFVEACDQSGNGRDAVSMHESDVASQRFWDEIRALATPDGYWGTPIVRDYPPMLETIEGPYYTDNERDREALRRWFEARS